MFPAPRSGRPRRYEFVPAPGFANPQAALAVGALDELTERLLDLLRDLPPEALHFKPQGAGNTIFMLTLHMAAAEARWVSRVTGAAVPPELDRALAPGMQDASGQLPSSSGDLAQLMEACRAARQFTRQNLAPITGLDRPVQSGSMSITAGGVLLHLLWHWTYHTGQAGLLRRLFGARYQWTFDKKLAGPAESDDP